MTNRIVIGLAFVASLGAQESPKPKTGNIGLYRNQVLAADGPAPKLADGTPDLSGVWLGGGASDADISNPKSLKPGSEIVMLPWAAELVKNRQSKEDPEASCLPGGIPR